MRASARSTVESESAMANDRQAGAVIGVDVGSASVRAGAFGLDGRRLAFAFRPIQQFREGADVVEQSSADIWSQTCAAVRDLLEKAELLPGSVRGIGFDATCSLVAVGPGGASMSVSASSDPHRDIVMWMDHRAGKEAAAINATRDPALAYVGGEVSLEMELPKVLWLMRHFPDRYAGIARFFDLADYMVWRCTGHDVASVCTLACKWNYLAHESRFPQRMLEAVGLGDVRAKIPERVLPLGTVAGTLIPEAAMELGLPVGTPVATGIIDAHAGGLALVGADPAGTLALIGGTSNCHMIASREPIFVPGVWGPYQGAMVPGWWLNEGGQSAAGALLDWCVQQSDSWPAARDQAEREGRSAYGVLNDWVADLAARERHPTRDLHVLPDHHGNRSPRADSASRGVVVGLSLESGPDALARLYLATIQALAYGTRHIIDAMAERGQRVDRVVMCGGGTKNPLLLQEHADALGRDIVLVAEEDAVTLGAALLAAVAGGAFADVQAAARVMVRTGADVRARPERKAFHDDKYNVFLGLYDVQRRCRQGMARWQ
jgi:FGGY-family pentulose kinase